MYIASCNQILENFFVRKMFLKQNLVYKTKLCGFLSRQLNNSLIPIELFIWLLSLQCTLYCGIPFFGSMYIATYEKCQRTTLFECCKNSEDVVICNCVNKHVCIYHLHMFCLKGEMCLHTYKLAFVKVNLKHT
jgi:hypothetical protein